MLLAVTDPSNFLSEMLFQHSVVQSSQPSRTRVYSFLMGVRKKEGKKSKYPCIPGILPAANKIAAEEMVKDRCYRLWCHDEVEHFWQVDESDIGTIDYQGEDYRLEMGNGNGDSSASTPALFAYVV